MDAVVSLISTITRLWLGIPDGGGNVAQRETLQNMNFGSRIAEEEADRLKGYFVKTDSWNQLINGNLDVVYGPKGSGKSALYSLLSLSDSELFDRGIFLLPAENPRGATAFRGITSEPPATELQFTSLWKLYFCSLIHQQLHDYGISNHHFNILRDALQAEGLVRGTLSLGNILTKTISYIRRVIRPQSVEGGITLDPITGAPSVTGKIIFSESVLNPKEGTVSVDSLLDAADKALAQAGFQVWVLLDRLDVAFAEHEELETNALRALFKVYLDLMAYDHIQLKIFLRTDIWKRITSGGFREASHITKHHTIAWTESSLLNLIIRRALSNESIKEFYHIGEDVGDAPIQQQHDLFYRIFPNQVQVGPNKSNTLVWMLSRIKDGLKINTPRELIHLLNNARELQSRRLEIGDNTLDGERLFCRPVIKEALAEVSKVRLEQTLYAEYPTLKPYLESLQGAKTTQTDATLAQIWGITIEESRSIVKKLIDIGFLEVSDPRNQQEYKIPFLYRPGLSLVQGREWLTSGNLSSDSTIDGEEEDEERIDALTP